LLNPMNMKPLAMITAPAKTLANFSDTTNPLGQTGGTEVSQQFGSFLNNAMNSLSDQEAQVDQLNTQMVAGNLPDVSQLMIASQKAELGLDLTLQVRNKVIEAYQEIMRIQM